jgi:hypothetical protein
MKFSVNLGFLWTDRALPDAIRASKAAGFEAVECHWPYDQDVDAVATAGLCCTNPMKDSPHESSMIAGSYEQLVPYKIQDDKLVVIQ